MQIQAVFHKMITTTKMCAFTKFMDLSTTAPIVKTTMCISTTVNFEDDSEVPRETAKADLSPQ